MYDGASNHQELCVNKIDVTGNVLIYKGAVRGKYGRKNCAWDNVTSVIHPVFHLSKYDNSTTKSLKIKKIKMIIHPIKAWLGVKT